MSLKSNIGVKRKSDEVENSNWHVNNLTDMFSSFHDDDDDFEDFGVAAGEF